MDKDALVQQIVSRGRNDKGAIRPEAVFQLRGIDGVSVARIAKEFGVSRNAIYKIIDAGDRKDLLPQNLKTDLMRLAPWKDVEEEHMKMAQRQYVAHHIEYMLTQGQGMAKYKLGRLRHFYSELGTDRVLTYNRNAPRNEWSSAGGWVYQDREEADGDLIVRTDDPLSEEQKKIFVRPSNWESV